MERARHRRLIVLRGSPRETAEASRRLTRDLDPDAVVFIAEDEPGATRPGAVRRLLGQSADAVVLSLHDGLDADVLGRCHGFVWGGGALILRMPPVGAHPASGQARLAVFPHEPSRVTHRFWDRFERCLADAVVEDGAGSPFAPPPHADAGTAEQSAVVAALTARFVNGAPSRVALLADRGRGKSSALGLAIARARADRPDLRVAVTAPGREAAAEVLRFAAPCDFVSPLELLLSEETFDVVVVDEAAQLPVPLLRRLVARFEGATLAFATTTRGYEGTGSGFVLRFVSELEAGPHPAEVLRLDAPIRWADDDPVERFVFDALLLDAVPASFALPSAASSSSVEHRILDRDALAADERLLRELFGLLVHAHYRTEPSDLHRLLDAPNVSLHALLAEGRVVAASLLAIEGGLDAPTCEALYHGRRRVRGHALPETLVCHSGELEAGGWSFVRSVRIATHPDFRRRGLASLLVEHVHRTHQPDFFGTMFGATPELLAFRRRVGYEVVRVGASRGVRSGEPAAVMLRPATPRAEAAFGRLRAVLARDLPTFLTLAQADAPLDDDLTAALMHALPGPRPFSAEEAAEIVRSYAEGPRTYETAATALEKVVRDEPETLAALDARARVLVTHRIIERRSWEVTARAADFDTVPAAMRALRRAMVSFSTRKRDR